MEDRYIIYKCRVCNRGFILFSNDVRHTEEESKFITCPYHGKHKDIIVVGAYEGIGECMDNHSYKRVNGKIRQLK